MATLSPMAFRTVRQSTSSCTSQTLRPTPACLFLAQASPFHKTHQLRTPHSLRLPSASQPHRTRTLATASSSSSPSSSASSSRRRSITPLSDDGHVPWTHLSRGEKLARTTQQTFNFGLVILGFSMTCGIVYLLWTNVAAPSSKTALFNRSVTEVRNSARAREALGPAKQIRAFGQGSNWNRWSRNAAIPATYSKDGYGREEAKLVFNVEGPTGRGVVRAQFLQKSKAEGFEIVGLKVEMARGEVIWVVGEKEKIREGKGVRFLGFEWGKK